MADVIYDGTTPRIVIEWFTSDTYSEESQIDLSVYAVFRATLFDKRYNRSLVTFDRDATGNDPKINVETSKRYYIILSADQTRLVNGGTAELRYYAEETKPGGEHYPNNKAISKAVAELLPFEKLDV